MNHTRQVNFRQRQSGVSMLVVLVVMMLSMLMVLGTSKLGILNEQMSGNNSDYQRAYEAAESVLRDAAIDVNCFNASCANRPVAVSSFTCTMSNFYDMIAALQAMDPPCVNGICSDLGALTNGNPATSFWGPTVNRLPDFTANGVAARYGQYTGSMPAAGAAVNPLLRTNAWYWIEILPYGTSSGKGTSVAAEQVFVGGSALKPDGNCSYAFRVTALARGQKAGTTAVIQALYIMRAP